jgi:hypothetical protein
VDVWWMHQEKMHLVLQLTAAFCTSSTVKAQTQVFVIWQHFTDKFIVKLLNIVSTVSLGRVV